METNENEVSYTGHYPAGEVLAGIPKVINPRKFRWCLWRASNGHVFLQTPNTVACLVYNYDRQAVAIVEQERVAVGFSNRPERLRDHDPNDGLILEAVAGHIEDFDIFDPTAAMVRELNEELGLRLDPDDRDVRLINNGEPLFTSPGHMTEKMWLGYVEVGNSMFDLSKEKFGLEAEGESTKRIWVPVSELFHLKINDMKTFALVQWFLRTIYPSLADAKGTI